MAKQVAGPMCPKCGVIGIEYIVSEGSAEKSKGGDHWFDIAYCIQCGHIHGIFNKIAHNPSVKMPSLSGH